MEARVDHRLRGLDKNRPRYPGGARIIVQRTGAAFPKPDHRTGAAWLHANSPPPATPPARSPSRFYFLNLPEELVKYIEQAGLRDTNRETRYTQQGLNIYLSQGLDRREWRECSRRAAGRPGG
ncbi:hypothetical protein DL766_008245 [Monosporascus sp. MC13-8B]|nr:hypothetical protein DL763_001344 [Monosporascus cannonballus]RYP20209.1 hypothetical protein DL766_008245 [Monosporascus sp. MC13-8B]